MYALVRLGGCAPDDQLFLECFNEAGCELPSRLYEADCAGGSREALAVAPLVDDRYLTLAFFAADAAGCVASDTVRLDMGRAAIESKANRLLRPWLVNRIGRIERSHSAEHVDIRFGPMAPASRNAMLAVHASASIDYRESFDPEITVCDLTGTVYDARPVVHYDLARTGGSDRTCGTRTLAFSFTVPETIGSLVVVVRDRSDRALWGFRALETGALKDGKRAVLMMDTDASRDPGYDEWFRTHRATPDELVRQAAESRGARLKFSIVVPLYRTPIALFAEMCDSVRAQSYGNWELVLVQASPDDAALRKAVSEATDADARIRSIELDENLGIVGNTNIGIRQALGDYVCFLDHDDTVEPDALFEYARAIGAHPGCAMLYSDEDKVLADGRHGEALFKSDFNIDRLRAHNCVCHFLCIARKVLDEIDLSSERHEGAQDHDLALKVSERTGEICHVPKVLYHWRVVEGSTSSAESAEGLPKPHATDAGRLAISEHLARLGIDAEVKPGEWPYTHRVRYLVHGEPLVSIVIPNKDASDLLERCITSILDKTTYGNLEIIVVENNSVEERTFAYYQRIKRQDERVRVVTWPAGFNYSGIVNFGVEQAHGEYLLLLNNDTEVIAGDWIEAMLGVCQRADVGAVGAKLLYPDGSIQHAGVVVGGGPLPAYHLYSLLPEERTGYFLEMAFSGDFSAVTAACMMVSRAAFESVGGFDEGFEVLYNDVDFCLKLRERGLLVVYEPAARLYHHESATRGDDYGTPEKKTRALAEASRLRARWKRIFEEGDPFSNPNLEPPYARLRFQ